MKVYQKMIFKRELIGFKNDVNKKIKDKKGIEKRNEMPSYKKLMFINRIRIIIYTVHKRQIASNSSIH
jgi:hypothetical protein